MKSADPGQAHIARINRLHKQVEEMSLEAFGEMIRDMQVEQPFLLALLKGYQQRGGYSPRQLDGMVKVLSVIWAFFREQATDGTTQPIEAAHFEAHVQANHELLSTWTRRGSQQLGDFLEQYPHRQLFTFVMIYFSQRLEFQPLQPDARAALIYECKSIIDCLAAEEAG